jgi:hypothetical protein
MANAVQSSALAAILAAYVSGKTLKVVLVDGAYTYSAAHDFLSDVPAGNRIATATLASVTTTGGVLDAADPTFPTVPAGDTIAGYWVYADSGTEATSDLLAWFDHDSGGSVISLPTNGSDIDLTLNASGILSI